MAHKQIFYYNTTSYQSGYTNKIEFNAEALSNDMQDTNIQGNKLYLEFSSPNGSPMERIIEIDSIAFDDGTFWEAEYQTEFTPDSPYESGNANNYIATISLDFTDWYTNGYCRIDLEDDIRDHNITIQMYYESISDDDEEDIDSSTAPSGTITLEQPLDDVMLTGSITCGSDWVLDGDTLYKDGVSIVHDELGGYLTNLSSISVNMAALLNEYGNGEYYVELRFTNDISGDSTVISSNRYNYYSPTAITPMRGTLTLSDDLILTLNIFDKPDGWNAAESVIHTPVRDIYDTLLDYNTPTAVVDLKDNLLNNEIDTLDELVSGQYSASITYFYGDEEATYTVTSNTVTVTYDPSIYLFNGELGSASSNPCYSATVEFNRDPNTTYTLHCIVDSYTFTRTLTPSTEWQSLETWWPSSENMSLSFTVNEDGDYVIDFTTNYGDTNSTIKIYYLESECVVEDSEVPSMTLALDVVNGKVTGSVSSLGEGYTEDEGSIYKCSNGSTINMQNDTWIGAIFTDSKYWTDNATDLDSLLKVGTTSIMTDDGTTSISEALAENGAGYYYVSWYITTDNSELSGTEGYGFQYSPVVYYEAQNDDEHIEPSGSLTVTTSNGTYTLSGSIDAGSHTKLTVEDYINISSSDGSIDIVLDDVDIETGTPAYPTLSINIDITKYLEGHLSGTYTASISVIDNPEDLSYHDEEYGDTFSTTFEYVGEDSGESSISLQLTASTGTITGSVNLSNDGYELEDTGVIYKCKNGSTIDEVDNTGLTDDIWVGEVFSFSDYTNISSINAELSAGITQDIDGASILDLISKSGTGYYYVRWYLINPNDTNDSRYFYSPVSYYKAEEPYQPKLNFINPTLKSLWQRLVNATDKICGVSSPGSWQVILTSGEKDSNCYPYVEGNMLYSNGDPWKMEEVDQGTVWSFDPSEPLDISGFNTSGNYHIYSPMGATGDYRLVYQSDTSSARSVGMKPIHDALLNHFDISHNNTPITPGDYMKGIAVAARYYSNGNIIDTTSTNSLSEIVTMLEGGVVTAAKCSECDIAFNSDESFITRNSTDGCTYYYHYNCAKKVGTIDPMTPCNYCGANLTVFEEYMYGDRCTTCVDPVDPVDPSICTYYNAQYHKTSAGELEAHYDYNSPTCICGADPCPEHGGYWTTSKPCPSCNNGNVCEFCGGDHDKYSCPYGKYCTNGTCDTWYDSRKSCPKCGSGSGSGSDTCPNCGDYLPDAGSSCGNCPWTPSMTQEWCDDCGTYVWCRWGEDYAGFKVRTCINGHQTNW